MLSPFIPKILTRFLSCLQQQKKHDGVEPQVGVEKDGNDKGENLDLQERNAMISYTQLLTAPPCDDDTYDDLFYRLQAN